MKKIFKIITLLLAVTFTSPVFASSFTFSEELYSGSLNYNQSAKPGEALTARISLKLSKSLKKKNNLDFKANLILFNDGKKIESSQFYLISGKNKKSQTSEYFTALPLSTWLDASKHYEAKVILKVSTLEEKQISLPFSLQETSFNSETLNLNKDNTNIKTNMSAERLSQIEKLNGILFTINPENVYTTKPFVRPVDSERYTAYFGDRRVYKYVTGKSETSLHYGNDYGVPEGTEVRACQDGKVVMAEFRISTGWSVCIEHLPGLYSLYYHLSSLSVEEGEMVKCGEKLGLSGQTGLATGPHLHWEVRLNACAVKPEFFMENYIMENAGYSRTTESLPSSVTKSE